MLSQHTRLQGEKWQATYKWKIPAAQGSRDFRDNADFWSGFDVLNRRRR